MNNTTGGGDAFRVIIPARRASQRLADKPLRRLAGKPLILHVHDNALRSGAERVVVATDDSEIAACVRDAGGEVQITSSDCASGSDRIAEAADRMQWEDDVIVVNVQGDEPFLEAEDVRAVAALARLPGVAMGTLSAPLEARDRDDPNVVKVVADDRGAVLSFSRNFDRATTGREGRVCRRHLGVYAYRCGYLRRFTRLPSPEVERRERLEQLRALSHGDRIQVGEAVSEVVLGIDTEEDLREAERLLGERELCESRVKVYFSVAFISGLPGLTDQLYQLKATRKLGLSLGYVYLHKRLHCLRNLWGAQPLNLPWPLAQLISRITWPRLVRVFPQGGIWGYLGLEQYFARQARKQASPSEYTQADIVLNDLVLEQNGVSTLEELQDYVKQFVSEEKPSERPLLLNIGLSYPLGFFFSIMSSIPDAIDDLDLRAVYSHHRRKRLRNLMPKQGLKTLVHIRQGDAAAVRTPWDTWIYWPRGEFGLERRWRECRNESEFSQLTVADFHRFIEGMGSRFADNAFAVQIFSDGFERTFSEIWRATNKGARLRFTQKQMNALLKIRRRYVREFKVFKKMKNSRLCVGEWPQSKFYRLVDAALTADLLVAAFPHQMMTFHLRRHFSGDDHPPAVLLYKPVAEKAMRDFLERNPSGKIIPVNISAPDFDRVAARLAELLPSLAPASGP